MNQKTMRIIYTRTKSFITLIGSVFFGLPHFFRKDVSVQNYWWFAFITFSAAIITIYIFLVPIQSIQKDIEEIKYDFPKIYNEQHVDTSDFSGREIVEMYYDSLNTGDYLTACSLMSTRQCTLYDVNAFTYWVKDKNEKLTIEYKDGMKLEQVWFSGEVLENTNAETWCAKISFQYNSEEDSKTVFQVLQHSVALRPDSKKEIRRSLCEYSFKNGEERSNQMGCYTKPRVCYESKP